MTDYAALVRKIEEDLRPGGWDVPATAYAILDDGRIDSIPLPAELGAGDPVMVLAVIAQSGVRLNSDVAAFAVANEAWAVDQEEMENHPWWEGPTRPSQHPRRRELRIISLVTRDREIFTVSRERISDEIISESHGTQENGGFKEAMGTRIPFLMNILLNNDYPDE